MESIPVSKFKATCLAVLQRVKGTGRPVITRFGQPIAQVVPPEPTAAQTDWLGSMAGRARVSGDVVGPTLGAESWDAQKQ